MNLYFIYAIANNTHALVHTWIIPWLNNCSLECRYCFILVVFDVWHIYTLYTWCMSLYVLAWDTVWIIINILILIHSINHIDSYLIAYTHIYTYVVYTAYIIMPVCVHEYVCVYVYIWHMTLHKLTIGSLELTRHRPNCLIAYVFFFQNWIVTTLTMLIEIRKGKQCWIVTFIIILFSIHFLKYHIIHHIASQNVSMFIDVFTYHFNSRLVTLVIKCCSGSQSHCACMIFKSPKQVALVDYWWSLCSFVWVFVYVCQY